MRRIPILALALLLAAAVGTLLHTPRRRAVRKTTIDVLPTGYRAGSLAVADDGTAHAYVVVEPAGERVVASAGAGGLHLACVKPTFAPRTTRLFYWAGDIIPEGPALSVVTDGQSAITEFKAPGVLVHSGDGGRWAAVGFTADVSEGEPGDIAIVVDGREAVRAPDLSLPSLSRDGAHLAYLAKRDDRSVLVVDGVERRTYDAPASQCAREAVESTRGRPDLLGRHLVRYLADGSLLVATRESDGWGVYRDDTRVASYQRASIDPGGEACNGASMFISTSMRVAEAAPVSVWWERLPGELQRWRVVRNGVPVDDVRCDTPWTSQPPEVSADGRHCAYACRSTQGEDQVLHVVRDGVRYGPYAEVWGFALSDGDGAHVAYGAVDAARASDSRPWSLYVDGRVRGTAWQAVWRPRVAKDGVTLAWEARTASEARGILGVNDVAIMQFEDIVWGPIFENNDRDVAWIVRRGAKLVRVTADVAELRRRARR